MPRSPISSSHRLTPQIRLAACAVAALSCLAGCSCSRETTDGTGRDGDTSASSLVVALGRLEPRDGVVDLHGLTGDRLSVLNVAVGQDVKQGDVLAVYESRALKELEVKSLKAQQRELDARRAAEIQLADKRIERAQLALEQAEKSQPDPETLEEQLHLAQANAASAVDIRDRLKGVGDDLIPQQQMDKQELLVKKAAFDLTAAETEVDHARRDGQLALDAAETDVGLAQAAKQQVLAAMPGESQQAAIELAEKQLELTQLVAPRDGTVLRVITRPGETMGRAPVLQMANLNQMVVVAEVYETDVKRLRLGQRATIKSKAFRPPNDQDGLLGKVEQIGRMISTPALKNLDPFAPADRRVMEVRIALDANHAPHAAEFVGLQVEVTFSETNANE